MKISASWAVALIAAFGLSACGGGGGGGGGSSGGGTSMIPLTEYFPGTTPPNSVKSGEGMVISGTTTKSGVWTFYNNPDGSLPDTPAQFANQHYPRWTKTYVNGTVTQWIEYNNDDTTSPSVRITSDD